MFKLEGINKMNDEQRLEYLLFLVDGLLSSEEDLIANLSNASALINAVLDGLNWVGFYLIKEGQLVIGPFQGLPACNRIDMGKGVCGTAAATKTTQIVPSVHHFPGHIACDSASNSELVVPIVKDDVLYGVLDLDSPYFNRFTQLEAHYIENFVKKLHLYVDWNKVCKL